MKVHLPLVTALVLCALAPLHADDGKNLRGLLQDHQLKGDWIYDDIEAGFAAAKKSDKPLLISFRCVP